MNTVASSGPASPGACPRCGAVIPSEAPDGLCPRCVLLGAATPSESGGLARRLEAPPIERVRAAFPQLEIRELIGQGGMGFVYAARQPQLDRVVAIKLLPVEPRTDPAFAERFAREGRLLARLNHPNIVAVYEFGQVDGFCFLMMEFVDGVNLRQAMRSGRFSPPAALAIVPKICEALQYAHDQGVLHRDIKPENILLDARGRVKIADFGIAKLVGERTTDITLTASGARLGTPHYMAPEQIESPSEVDHRADIYSLGVVFYELLTGELPLGRFAAPSAKADIDARVDEIVLRALSKERELRQQSAGEMKTEVEGLGSGAAPKPKPEPVVPHGTPWNAYRNFEYRWSWTLFGLPLVHVVCGVDPDTGRMREARGILAVGPRAVGWIAVGGQARGILAVGGVALGVFSFGGLSVGVFSLGGLAVGLLSYGGLAFALRLAFEGVVGWEAFGRLAVGNHESLLMAMTGNLRPGIGLLLTLLLLAGFAVGIWILCHRTVRLAFGLDGNVVGGPAPNPWPHRLFWLVIVVFALPASALSSGGMGGITAGMVPMVTGAMLAWLAVLTRPTSAQAKPRAERNPWPQRIFWSLLVLLLIPALVSAALILPWMAMRKNPRPDAAFNQFIQAVQPPLAAPVSVVSPATGIQLIPVERGVTPESLKLRWRLQSDRPGTVRLTYKDESTTYPLEPTGEPGRFGATIHVIYVRHAAEQRVGLAIGASGQSRTSLPLVWLRGDPDDVLAKANEMVAGDLALKPNISVWIAFGGLEQVGLEVLSEAPTPLVVPSPQTTQDAVAALELEVAEKRLMEYRKRADWAWWPPQGKEVMDAELAVAEAQSKLKGDPRIVGVLRLNRAQILRALTEHRYDLGYATTLELEEARMEEARAKAALDTLPTQP